MFRRSMLVPFGLLALGLPVVPAGGQPGGAPAPAAVRSEYLAFVHLDAKEIRESAIFTELKQAVTKAGGEKGWEQIEAEAAGELGVKPTDVDTVTMCLVDVPGEKPMPVLIVTANKALPKSGLFGLKPGVKPDAQGFYRAEGDTVAHFSDDKTVAVMYKGFASKYLAGYARDRTGWPLTADLTKAATGHTLFVNVRADELSADGLSRRGQREFGALLAAKSATLAVDLKERQVSVTGRAAFPNATAAGKARHKVHALIGLVGDAVDQLLADKDFDLGAVRPAVKEAERALAAAKAEVTGSDVTLAADYKLDSNFGTMAAPAVMKAHEAMVRRKAQNNLKQIGLALHNYEGVSGHFPIHATGAKGQPVTAGEKSLLSWRVAILPYLERPGNSAELYKQFKLDEPWDSSNNKKLIEKMPAVFAPNKPGKAGHTPFQMAIGPGALTPGRATIATFTDGTSNTVAVAEAAEPVVWTKPDDVMLPGKDLPKDFRKRFGGQYEGGFNALMWDGSVRFVSDKVSDRTLGLALNPSDGHVLGDDW